MKTKTILSISDARKKIFEITKKIQKSGVRYIFTDKGRPRAVMMSAKDFDSLLEDLEVLGNSAQMAAIKRAESEFERGEYVTLKQLEKELGYKKNAK